MFPHAEKHLEIHLRVEMKQEQRPGFNALSHLPQQRWQRQGTFFSAAADVSCTNTAVGTRLRSWLHFSISFSTGMSQHWQFPSSVQWYLRSPKMWTKTPSKAPKASAMDADIPWVAWLHSRRLRIAAGQHWGWAVLLSRGISEFETEQKDLQKFNKKGTVTSKRKSNGFNHELEEWVKIKFLLLKNPIKTTEKKVPLNPHCNQLISVLRALLMVQCPSPQLWTWNFHWHACHPLSH